MQMLFLEDSKLNHLTTSNVVSNSQSVSGEAATRGVLEEKCLRPATILKRDSSTGVFL